MSVIVSNGVMLGCGSGIAPLPALTIPQTNEVVFIGDSITANWGQSPVFKMHPDWINKGISGQTSLQVALRFQKDVVSLYPKTVHIMVGTNDVYPGWHRCAAQTVSFPAPGDTCSNILFMLRIAQHYGIKVVIGTIPPWGCEDDPYCGQSVADETPSRYNRISELNDFLESLASEQGVNVIDYHSILADGSGAHYENGLTDDGVHPSEKGYEDMTPSVVSVLK